MLNHYFSFAPLTNLPRLQTEHHLGLVALSVIVAIAMALMALQTANIARYSPSRFFQHLALITGALALAAGIWTTHFIGMLAFVLPAPMEYRAGLSLLSLVPALFASGLAMFILVRPKFTNKQVVVSGTLMGVGISLMHYIGMAAIITPLSLRYDPWLVLLSVFWAALFSVFALRVRFRFDFKLPKHFSFYLSALLFGVGIAAMHYTGMAAMTLYGEPSPVHSRMHFSDSQVALVLALLCVSAGGLVAALNGLIRTRMFYRSMVENKGRLQAILDTAVDAIITIDGQGRIQEFNLAAERLFGYQASEVAGHNIKMLMPEPYHSEHDGYLSNFRKTGTTNIIGIGREVVARRKDGSTLPVRLAVGQVEKNDPSDLLFVGMLSDISHRHALEASLREEAQRAELAVQAKSNFLANMSHEIRTPMNAILGFTDLLLNTELSPAQRAHLQTIRQSSGSLLSLINDILDTTKIEQGYLELENNHFSLIKLAEQTQATLYLSAQIKGLYLKLDYPPSMPHHFTGDPLRIAQILTNLVGNAIKFTEQGGVQIKLSYAQERVCIQVQDTGIGMSPEQAQGIFEPFTQADASISRRFGGSGLGTTIALQLAEAMGGEIQLDTAPRQGSNFSVYLPLAVADPATEKVQPNEQSISLPKLTLLIADDVEQNLQLLRLVLEQAGHVIVAASNGREALEHYQAGQFDAVLMDLHMPEIDGLQATQMIREHEHLFNRKRTPIIALTASVMARDRSAAEHAGMDGFAVKPLNTQQLFAEIARVLKLSHPAPQPAAPSSPMQTIDWHAGVTLWGSREALAQQVCSFLGKAPERYPLLASTDASIDRQALQFTLHSLRGVAGNLALTALTAKAAELEHLLPTAQPQQLHAALQTLNTLLAAAQTEAQAALVKLTPQPAPPLTQPSSQPIEPLIQQALNELARNEINTEQLERLYQCLTPDQAQQLREAIDSFEFSTASAYLTDLLETQQQHPSD